MKTENESSLDGAEPGPLLYITVVPAKASVWPLAPSAARAGGRGKGSRADSQPRFQAFLSPCRTPNTGTSSSKFLVAQKEGRRPQLFSLGQPPSLRLSGVGRACLRGGDGLPKLHRAQSSEGKASAAPGPGWQGRCRGSAGPSERMPGCGHPADLCRGRRRSLSMNLKVMSPHKHHAQPSAAEDFTV